MERSKLHQLTGIRGIAVMVVVFYHLHTFDLCSGWCRVALRHGYLSVDLFFALSGFVMAFNYGKLFRIKVSSRQYINFLIKRLGRVYPLYVVLILFVIVLKYYKRHLVPGRLICLNLLMVQSWGFAPSILGPSWSISTEWAAYLAFPILAGALLFSRRSVATTLGIAVGIVLVALAEVPSAISHVVHFRGPMDIVNWKDYGPILRCLGGFILGMLAYRISRAEDSRKSLRKSWPSVLTLGLILLLLAIPDTDIFIILLFPVLIVLLSNDQPLVSRVAATPLLRWLGEISYSVYLIHATLPLPKRQFDQLALRLHWHHADAIWVVFVVCSVLLIATASYWLIEAPARNFVRARLGGARSEPAVDAGLLSAP